MLMSAPLAGFQNRLEPHTRQKPRSARCELRYHDSAASRAFHAPGREIQRLLATKEPTAEQLEVGIAALAEILRAEQAGGVTAGDEPPPAT